MPSIAEVELGQQLGKVAIDSTLNLLNISGRTASGSTELVEAAKGIASASDRMQAPIGTAVRAEVDFVMDRQLATLAAPGIMAGRAGPTYTTFNFDSASALGRTWTAAKQPLAVVSRMPLDPLDPISYGSGFAVRSDGLVLAASHTVRSTARGDIWVKLLHQPGPAFQARILDEDKAEDLVLLKPRTPIGRIAAHVPISNFADSNRLWKGTDLVTVGAQNQITNAAGVTSADAYLVPGKFLDKVPVRFSGEAPVERLRASMPGEYGLSGAGTYEVSNGRLVGAMLGGFDNQWSGIAPANKIRSMIARNLTR